MSTPFTIWRPDKILAASDLSPVSDKALQYAAAIARHFHAYVYVTHVVAPGENLLSPPQEAEVNRACRQKLQDKIAAIFRSGQKDGVRQEILLEKGFLWQTLDTLIRKHAIDCVIVGTHGHKEINEEFGGSWAELIFRHADCPVITVGPSVADNGSGVGTFKKILLATDFSRASQRSVPYACSLAEEYGASLTLLHVLNEGNHYSPEGLTVLDQTTKVQLLESLPPGTERRCTYDLVVRYGDSAQGILDVARSQRADLIVMGAKSGRTILNHLPEPATYTVAAKAPCPVLSIRA